MGVPVAFDAVCAEGRSTYREYGTTEATDEVIACTWIGVSGWARSMRIVPDGCCDITFDGASLWVMPPSPRATLVHLGGAQTSIGVRLRPERAHAVLGDLRTLGDGPVDLSSLWDGSKHLATALADVEAPQARIDVVVAEVFARYRPGVYHGPLGEACRALDEGAPVRSVARDIGMSERHLRREFTRSVGIGPKQYARLARFQRALARIRGRPEVTFADIAASCGFADEAHLARECRAIASGNLTSLRRVSAGSGPSDMGLRMAATPSESAC